MPVPSLHVKMFVTVISRQASTNTHISIHIRCCISNGRKCKGKNHPRRQVLWGHCVSEFIQNVGSKHTHNYSAAYIYSITKIFPSWSCMWREGTSL